MTAPSGLPPGVAEYDIGTQQPEIDSLLDELRATYASACAPEFLLACRPIAFRRLPGDLVDALSRFHDAEAAPVQVVRGLSVDDGAIGPTPSHWAAQRDPESTAREEFYFMLLAGVLGDPFGWATLQDGRLVGNVLPIRDQEKEQSGHGSADPLAWHTEDGFHPYRCDYLGLMTMRNDELVPTTVAWIDAHDIELGHRHILFEPRFVIRPDNEHLNQRRREHTDEVGPLSVDWEHPAPTAVLFGDHDRPYLRIDPYFMSAEPGDEAAAEALADIVARLERNLQPLPLEPGAVCFIDNYRAVHGRQAFRAHYDGRDRWLKKLVLARDLRKSRVARGEVDARVLNATLLDPDRAALAVVQS